MKRIDGDGPCQQEGAVYSESNREVREVEKKEKKRLPGLPANPVLKKQFPNPPFSILKMNEVLSSEMSIVAYKPLEVRTSFHPKNAHFPKYCLRSI
jgi:hypothetical protein